MGYYKGSRLSEGHTTHLIWQGFLSFTFPSMDIRVRGGGGCVRTVIGAPTFGHPVSVP